jgi:CelD/BcsL family acetyltransferase involved in cellulose biosynthesis
MQVSVLEDRRALAAIVPEWQALAARAVEPNPFYEDWMLLPALEAFGDANLAAVAVRSPGDGLVGLFPLERRARLRGLPARALVSWSHRHCLLSVPLVRADRAPEVLHAFFRAMRRKASIVQFALLPAEGPFHHALVEALAGTDVALAPSDSFTRALLVRAADADAYVRTALSHETRSEMRRLEKRLGQMGRVEHRVLRPGDDIARWIADFMALELAGWKGRVGSALACTAANRHFGTEILRRGFERGRLLMVGLDLDGRPVARYSLFLAGAGAFAFKTAYDEQLRRAAPGILVELDMVRALHEVPGLQWADSYTTPDNPTISRFWRARRAMHRVALGMTPWGKLVLAALPLGRYAKREISPVISGALRAILAACSRARRMSGSLRRASAWWSSSRAWLRGARTRSASTARPSAR